MFIFFFAKLQGTVLQERSKIMKPVLILHFWGKGYIVVAEEWNKNKIQLHVES